MQLWHAANVVSEYWGESGVAVIGCYTLQGRCVCVFGVKCGDLYGSERAVARGADWHSDAG